MCFGVNLFQGLGGNGCRSGGDGVRETQHFLEVPYVGAALQHPGRGGMVVQVARAPLDHDGAGDVLLYRPASGQPIFGYTCNKFWRRSGKEIWQDLV